MDELRLKELWRKHIDLIRLFVDRRGLYQRLAAEIADILRQELKAAGVEFSNVTHRGKSLASFLDKLERKKYSHPLEEIRDLAGVRVVHLYASDLSLVEEIISREFSVEERVDKLAGHGDDRFGYGATHYAVKLSSRSSSVRYDELRCLYCEIQVRTILQDAWAVVSHHLVYKRESDIPHSLRRRINSLAGLFETADDQFERLRTERKKYIDALQARSEDSSSLYNEEINIDTVAMLLKKDLPELPLASPYMDNPVDHVAYVLEGLDPRRYTTIGDLRSVLRRTAKARDRFRESELRSANVGVQSATGELAVALGLDDPLYRKDGWDADDLVAFHAAEHLIETS